MPFEDRKRKIMEHLGRSSDGVDYSVKKTQDRGSTSSIPTPTPAANPTPAPIESVSSTPTPVNKEPASASTPTFSLASQSAIGSKVTYKNSASDRQRSIMQHVKSTAAGIKDFSLEPKDRKRKIQEHLRQSKG